MFLFSIAFLISITSCLFFSIPYIFYFFSLFLLFFKTWLPSAKQTIPFCILFFMSAFSMLDKKFPYPLNTNKIMKLQGTIASVPEINHDKAHFNFLISKINSKKIPDSLIKLSWNMPPALHVGEEWQFQAGLHALHSPLNPGSFNYEHWARAHHIKANGFVLAAGEYEKFHTHFFRFGLAHLRENIATHISTQTHSIYSPFLTALSVGLRQGITSAQWQVLQATGTNHLIAIAGLHIGFLTTFVMGFIYFIWRNSNKLALSIPTPIAASGAALIAAFIYSALAGFSLPTLRALIMLTIFLLSIMLRRAISFSSTFSSALVILLLFNPLAVLEESFWLSFGSVALIIYATQGRLQKTSLFWQSIKLQWILTVGLIPFTILFFQQISSVSFISNAIAIPCVGWLILPLCFTGVLFIKISWLSHSLFYLANQVFAWLWWFLERMASLQHLQHHLAMPSKISIFTTFIGMIILLAPAGFPARYLAGLWWLPLFINYAFLHEKELKLSILNLEKGQSILLQTAHHTLLFDTGNKQEDNDAGIRFIIPLLRILKITTLDTLIISSNEKSFYGGTQSIVNQLPIKKIITTTPALFANGPILRCEAGTTWEWDKVQFKIIYPSSLVNNDLSPVCVLLVTTSDAKSFLLTGALSAQGFKNLFNLPLPASFWLITPRYGSTTKSLQNFIKKTGVEHVVLSGKNFNQKTYFTIPIDSTDQRGMISVVTKPTLDSIKTTYMRQLS